MTPELSAHGWLKRHAPRHWHLQRIETSTASGVPDLIVATPVGEVWIELKAGTRPEIRPFQRAWMTVRTMAGGRCVILWAGPKESLHLWLVDPNKPFPEIDTPPDATAKKDNPAKIFTAIHDYIQSRS